ncbi:MAG: sensor histidine kinase [Clostridiales bacterium]|nr:sensor histidine kinase [Clostridiales bacterium]
MRLLVDKAIIFIVSLAFYASDAESFYMIVPILIVMALSAILSYIENPKVTLGIYVSYLLLCLYRIEFIPFIPLLSYDIAFMNRKNNYLLCLLSFFPIAIHNDTLPSGTKIFTAAFILVAVLLKNRTLNLENTEESYYNLRDTTREISLKLESQNKELIEKQDYEVHLATITERNRIARDIHDNVGHLLSRSILQVGALLAINKDKNTIDNLTLVKDTLSEAMDSIRASVHDLHEDAVDLQNEIQKLVDSFTFCSISFYYDVDENVDKNIKYCFIAVVKESLSNVMKHSNASEVSVTIVEHPAIYPLIIKDNGTKGSYDRNKGIGIQNIEDRVNALDGNMHISTENGFRIFISIPKRLV